MLSGVRSFIKKIYKHFDSSLIFLYTAESSYYILFSTVPFLMLMVMASKKIFEQRLDGVFEAFFNKISDLTVSLPTDLMSKLLSFNVPWLSVTLFMTVWSASKWARSLSSGLCAIYKVKSRDGFIMRYVMSVVYTLLFIVAALLSLGVMIWGNIVSENISCYSGIVRRLVIAFEILRAPMLFMLLAFFIMMIYKTMAARTDSLKMLFPGAAFSGVAWTVYSALFSLYIKYYSNYGILYGSMGLILLFMLWVYNCVFILFLGAQINVYFKSKPLIVK